MNKIKKILGGLSIVSLRIGTQVFADLGGFSISNYDVEMDLHQDGSATVTEHIDVQFYENRHGIYREIPLVGNVPVDVSNINVDQVFRTEKTNTQASIRIGDPAKYVNGLVSYSISYDVYGALIPFSGGQELYRNLIGTNRDTTIQDIDFEIHFPTKVELNQQKIYFYYGAVGAKNSEAVSFTYDQDALIGELQTVLNPYEGLTIGIEFPDSYFTLDTERLATLQQQSKQYYTPTSGPISSRNRGEVGKFRAIKGGGLGIIGVLIVLTIIFGIPKKRDKKIIPQYDPPKGINPTELGLLIDSRPDPSDILALFYYRAANGFLQIHMKEEKILLFKKKLFDLVPLKALPEDATSFEQTLRQKVFGAELKTVTLGGTSSRTIFLQAYQATQKELKHYVKEKKRYKRPPQNRVRFMFIGGLVSWLAMFGFIGVNANAAIFAVPNIIIIECIFWVFARQATAPTEEGGRLIDHALGYKKFLKQVDEDKLRSFLREDPLYIDKTLGFAVAMGIGTKFIKTISGMLQDSNIHSRYHGDPSMDLAAFSSSFASAFSSSTGSSSSSSGSSGGGGGGGGGGSW